MFIYCSSLVGFVFTYKHYLWLVSLADGEKYPHRLTGKAQMKTLKIGEITSLILALADEWLDGKESEQSEIDFVATAMSNHVSIRDWAMGELPLKFDSAGMAIGFLQNLTNKVSDNANRVPLITITAILLYACDEVDLSKEMISTALEINSEYSLALLIQKVQKASWPVSAVQNMFEELHPNVKTQIAEISDEEVAVS
jgi:hypothetical protein